MCCNTGDCSVYRICQNKDGKEFNVLNFRSMRIDAEKDGVARLNTGDKDDRITPVGKVIRKIRFDKLLMDLTYIGTPSLWEDFKICLATVKILFMPESTEGVEEEQVTDSYFRSQNMFSKMNGANKKALWCLSI